MKKLSLLFVFVVLAVALFAITAFAEDTNIAKEGTWTTSSGFWAMKLDKLTDGNYEVACTAHNNNYYTIFVDYDGICSFSKMSFVVNSKGNVYNVGNVAETSNNDWWFTVKLYDAEGTVVYTSDKLQTLDQTKIDLTFDTPVNASKVEIYSFVASHVYNCFWEIELYGHVCSYTELIEETPAPTCMDTGLKILGCSECDSTKEEIIPAIGSHTWDEGVITTDPTESTEGIKTFTCTVCQETKTEKVQPSGHNWDNGTVVPPSCTDGGYTIYKCTDDGCDKSYKIDPTDALGHDFDNVITVAPTLTKEGEQIATCKIDGCGHSETQSVPVATMADSSFIIGRDNVLSFVESLTCGPHEKRDYEKLFDGIEVNASDSQSNPGGWFGTNGSTLTITFDEEYYIVSFNFHAWSNYARFNIDFFDATGTKIALHQEYGYQDTSVTAHSIDACVGKYVKSIKITVVDAKNPETGQCLDFQEFIITAHKHVAEGENAKYDEVVGCVDNGSYKKFCYVCEKEVLVETAPLGEHELTSNIEFPKGFDMNGSVNASCSRCEHEEKQRLKPIFYSYGYSVREDGGAIAHKFEVDLDALAAYESYAGAPLVFGTVAAATPNFEGTPIEIVDGAVVGTSDRVSVKTLSGNGYVFIEDRISNIPEFAYDTEVVLCPFVYDGKSISYINVNSNSGEAFETVSYNGLLAK